MGDGGRALHKGSLRYLLVPRGTRIGGERIKLPDRESARSFLAGLDAEPGNRELLRAVVKDLPTSVPKGFGGRPDEDEWAPLIEAISRGAIEVVKLVDHPVSPLVVRTTGTLTLSEVSWGETCGLYPTKANLYRPDKWDQEKLIELLRARSAVTDVATRNGHVRKAKPGSDKIEQMMRPYHCTENFPVKDVEIDEKVKWFYLSPFADKPIAHPGLSQTSVIVKTYGPFYNTGGGDVSRGDVYLHFYRL